MFLEKEYKQFDKLMSSNGDEEVINELFADILEKAIIVLNERSENKEFLEYPKDMYVIRALFEYFLELWSEGEWEEAKNLGYDLVYMVNDENLKEAFSLFVLGVLEKLPVEKFLDIYVNPENETDEYDMFFTNFNDEIDELVIKHRETFKKEFSE
ncbi:MAG: hypothetical protein DSY40_03080 [Nautilia sp.]|nr:MAG: hypothetical protein DSY40_03080 [Nautilia sp.]